MKKIILIPNLTRDPDYQYTEKVEALLSAQGLISKRYTFDLSHEEEELLFKDAFAILVLGGDGTILHATDPAIRYDLPILAVNLGRLGYIAQLERDDLDKIPQILSAPFEIEERAMLSVSVIREGNTVVSHDALLNDAVIGKVNACGIIEFELYAGNKKVSRYRGDGLILATATGSTAYSMSAGGAVIDPTLRVIEVTPLAVHSLKARPTVFSDKQPLNVLILPSKSESAITFDGDHTLPLLPNDRIFVTISEKTTKLIAYQHDFCRILYQKMTDL